MEGGGGGGSGGRYVLVTQLKGKYTNIKKKIAFLYYKHKILRTDIFVEYILLIACLAREKNS